MIPGITLHHIGYTVEDIAATARQFTQLGYTAGNTIHDEALTVELCYLTMPQTGTAGQPGSPTIELVHQLNTESLETQLISKNGVMPYHLGFVAEDIHATCQQLVAMGYTQLFPPVPVKALGGQLISYLHHPNLGYIEILSA